MNRIAITIILCVTSFPLAFHAQTVTDYRSLAIRAFEEYDYKSAEAAIRKMGQDRDPAWYSYSNALETFRWLTMLKESFQKFESTKSTNGFREVEHYYAGYKKSFFASGDILHKLPASLKDQIGKQQQDALNIYNRSVAIEQKRVEELAVKREEERKERERIAQEMAEQKRRDAEERMRKEIEKEKAKERIRTMQTNAIDRYVRENGYDGFVSSSVLTFLRKAQIDGDLGSYLNHVIGSIDENKEATERQNRKLKLVQQFQGQSLYEYTNISGGAIVSISLFVETDPSSIELEGQSLRSGYYAFVGMKTYTTVLGAQRTLPCFEEVDIPKGIINQAAGQ